MNRATGTQRRFAALALSLLLSATSAPGQPQEPAIDSALECISLQRVVRTEVLDEQTIRFHLRGQESYSNHLPQECPGLDARSRFTYETTSSRLCNRDTITLLEQGSRLAPGIACRLGKFVPASAEEAVDLTLDESRDRGRAPLEIRRVELDAADTDAPATAEPAPSDRPEAPRGTDH